MKQVVDGKIYNTETATRVANEYDRNGRNSWGRWAASLYKTKKGNFFALHESSFQGESDRIEPLDTEAAKPLYNRLPEGEKTWEEVFGEVPEEA